MALTNTSKKIANYAHSYVNIALALCCGIGISLAFLQEDSWFKELIENSIQSNISSIIKADFFCRVKDINFFAGEITLNSIVAASSEAHDQWSITCPIMTMHFTWSGLIFRSTFEVDVTFYQPIITSEIQAGVFAVSKPLNLLIQAPAIMPFYLTSCALRQARLDLFHQESTGEATFLFSSDTFYRESFVKTTVSCSDGVLRFNKNDWMKYLYGTITLDIPFQESAPWQWRAQLAMDAPHIALSNKRCSLIADYHNGIGIIEFCNMHKSLFFEATHITYNQKSLTASLKASGLIPEIAHYAGHYLTSIDSGKLAANGRVVIHDDYTMEYTGSLSAEALRYGDSLIEQITIMAEGTTQAMKGHVTCLNALGINASGFWQWHDSKLIGTLTNTQKFQPCSALAINAGEAFCTFEVNNKLQAKAQYALACETDQLLNQKIVGTLKADNQSLELEGTLSDLPYQAHFSLEPFGLTLFNYKSSDNKNLIFLEYMPDKALVEGFIDGKIVSSLISYLTDYTLHTDGRVLLEAQVTNTKLLKAQVVMQDAHIRLPYTHTIIREAKGALEVDIAKRIINFKDVIVKLHKGTVSTLATTLHLSQSGTIDYIHMPLKFNNCLITGQKEFFGLLSGSSTGIYRANDSSSVSGQLVLDKSHLRSNLLSGQVQKDIIAATLSSFMRYKIDVLFNLGLTTRAPLKVKTVFLETKAHINITLNGTLYRPELSGVIELQQGTLLFPYKPLYINKATLYLMPQELDDPAIDLLAKNKIKKYIITMHVTGSLRQPKITFESSPTLQEEQIITLLLAGTQEGSLCLVMPQAIMQGLENLLFGPVESSFSWQHYLMTILKPLKSIRIVPGVHDQTGKGAKGGVEIDLTDRLHASIENNLIFSEDTQLELEYTLSDDISVRGTKDERGNLAGEIEMRWKF